VTATDSRSEVPQPAPPADDAAPAAPPEGPAEPPAPKRRPAPRQPADDGLDAGEALPRLARIAREVVAPATLVTALLFQFGRLQASGFYRHFGVNFTVMDLTVQDHLISSADGLFVPVAAGCVLALLLLWLHRLLLARTTVRGRRRTIRVLAPAAGVLGVSLVALALLDLLAGVGLLWRSGSEAGGLALAAGALLIVYAVRLVRLWRGRPRRRSSGAELAEWGAAFLLVSVGLYWAVGQYAFGVGTGRALQLERALPTQPAAVLFSAQSLSLDVDGVTEVECADPEAAYRFRYDGLRLVRQSGDQYLLLSSTWSRETGSAVLIPRGGDVRLEFRTASSPAGPC
jgi:hypothetical protein